MCNLDCVDPGLVKGGGNLADVLDTVLVSDRMHPVAQSDVLNVKIVGFWIERHQAVSLASRCAAIFSAVAMPADVIMSRFPAYAGK